MNESKPNSGWNESKPSFPIAMNVGEAMAYASKDKCFCTGEMHIALEMLGDEVKRLQAEVQRLDMAGTHSCHDDCQRLPCVQRREIERLRAELAAAKAASVVSVKWKSLEQFFQGGADLGNQWGMELWFENKEQREQFHKWLKERGEG